MEEQEMDFEILFLDADDVLLPGILPKMVDKIINNRADFCIGNYIEVRQDTGAEKAVDAVRDNKTVIGNDIAIAFTYPPCPTTKLFRKKIIVTAYQSKGNYLN